MQRQGRLKLALHWSIFVQFQMNWPILGQCMDVQAQAEFNHGGHKPNFIFFCRTTVKSQTAEAASDTPRMGVELSDLSGGQWDSPALMEQC